MEKLLANPRITIMALALILVAGLGAMHTLPRLEDPHITNRHALVVARFPGASSERVEALVAEPLERKLREIPEIENISSNSRAGIAAVSVQLNDYVGPERTAELWSEIRDKLREAQPSLPAEVSPPSLDAERGYAFTWIAALRWQQGEGDLLQSGRLLRELASRLGNVPGTDIVRLYGLPEEEIRVEVDPVAIASLGMDVSAVSRRIAESDAKVAAGEVHNPNRRMPVEIAGAFEQLERVRQIPLRSSESGATAQLGDVAEVFRGEKTPPAEFSIVHGERTAVIAVRMLPDHRGDHWTKDIEQAVQRFSADLPQELRIDPLFVQERYNRARLGDLLVNIAMGFSLIVLVLWVSLGWRSAILVALALPMTILFSLACMRLVDLPIHQISVVGLIVALGIMIDNAIVVADTVMRHRREGFAPVAAAARTFRRLWLPLLGSTLTTVLAFMPIVLQPGPAGEFVGGIAIAVVFSLIGSWLISLFLIAPLAGRWLSGKQAPGLRLPRINAGFRRLLALSLQRPRTTMLLILLLPAAGFIAAPTLPEQFFPASDRDMINLELYLPASAGINATRRATEELSEYLQRYPEIVDLHWFIGRSAPMFYYNLQDHRDGNQNYAQAMLSATDFRAANRLVGDLQRQLGKDFPQYQLIVRRLEQGPPSAAPVELRLYGPELGQLRQLGESLRGIALATPDVLQVRSSLGEVVPKLWFHVDPVEGQASGVGLTDLSAKLHADLEGVSQGSVLEATEQLPLRVRVADIDQVVSNDLELLPMALPGGARPLMALAETELRPAPAVITRRNGERVNTVEVYIRDGVLPSVVLKRIMAELQGDQFALPAAYRLEIGGEDESRDRAVARLMSSVGVILVLLAVTVLMAFNSFRFSLVIFVVAAQAAGLGLLSLFFSGFPFGFTAIIALMGLIGLAVNAAIVILLELKNSPPAMAGNREAIVEGVSECTRHISSTTVTTVAGLLPLMLSGGGLWPPFAVVLAGGTLMATLLSLVFVPAAFLVLRKPYVAELWQRRYPGAGSRQLEEGATTSTL